MIETSYGVGLFDDRIAISGYDFTSGMDKVLIDTGAKEVCEWMEALYGAYRRELPTLALQPPTE